MRIARFCLILLGFVAIAACQPSGPAAENVPSGSAVRATDVWLGRWIGPEGTFLEVAAEGDSYRITIQSLDGPATYAGVPENGRIRFERDGTSELIRAGSGQQTGMKWLLEKNDCLFIRAGEGFCRD